MSATVTTGKRSVGMLSLSGSTGGGSVAAGLRRVARVDEAPTVESVVAELAADDAVSGDLGEPGAMAVTELLEWKAARDRRLERWRVKDVEAFMLAYAPQQLASDPAFVDAVPAALERYLGWLDTAGRLRGDPLPALRERLAALAPAYA